MVNRRLVHRYPLEALLRNAVFIATIVLAVTTGLGVGGITVIVGAVFVFFSMNGIIADFHGLRSNRLKERPTHSGRSSFYVTYSSTGKI